MELKIAEVLEKMDKWNENSNWKAYDPFDGLSTPYLNYLTFKNPLLRIVLQQANRRIPLNIRPLIGVKPDTSSKAMGFFAQGYLRLYRSTKEQRYLERLKFCLNWLLNNYSKGYSGYAWGNHFDYQSRGGRIKKGAPTVVWTGLIGHAFLDAYEIEKDDQYFEVAESICDFIVNDLKHSNFGDSLHIAYSPDDSSAPNNIGNLEESPEDINALGRIHNSSVIGASLLARVYSNNKKAELLDIAKKAIKYTVSCQLENGAWYYGEKSIFHWVDSFHTGYVLESIYLYNKYSEDPEFLSGLKKGFDFYLKTFFKGEGVPYYYDNKMRPLDIQCASQGIQTLVNLSEFNEQSIPMAKKVADWTIRNMFDDKGFFYFRKYPFITNKTPTLHWGQATMFAALATLFEKLKGTMAKPT